MGLDRDDLIVRRRLAQKLTFVVQDTSDLAQPTDQDLRLIYEANRFQTPAGVSFSQIYFSREQRHDAADAKAASAELRHSTTAGRPPTWATP
jgi:hypothetical protein